MKHNPNSADLEELKSFLAKSFDAAEGDDVPPLPESLRDRIADQYGRTTTPAPESSSQGFFSWLTSLFAQPAFAGVAAALVLVLTATVLLNKPDEGATFRGTDSAAPAITLVLFQVDAASTASIRESGLFDEKAMRTAATPAELAEIKPPRIVINGSTGTIQAYAEGSDTPVEADLPADPTAIADAIADLLKEVR